MGAQGHTTVDFGATPTGGMVTIAITGQAGILSTSDVEAWIRCEDSSNHSADEHIAENLKVRAGKIIVGTGFGITVECTYGHTKGVFNVSWVWS